MIDIGSVTASRTCKECQGEGTKTYVHSDVIDVMQGEELQETMKTITCPTCKGKKREEITVSDLMNRWRKEE